MVIQLREEQDLAPLLERSQKEPIVFFKHSTQCSRSAAAHEELQKFQSKNPSVPCGMVLVIEDRNVSNAMEDQLGIEHESPQVIVVCHGKPVWHAAHYRVTAKALEEAIAAQKA